MRECVGGRKLRARWGMGTAEREGEEPLGGWYEGGRSSKGLPGGQGAHAGEGAGGCSSACQKGAGSMGRPGAAAGSRAGTGHMVVERGGVSGSGAQHIAVVLGILFPCWPSSCLSYYDNLKEK